MRGYGLSPSQIIDSNRFAYIYMKNIQVWTGSGLDFWILRSPGLEPVRLSPHRSLLKIRFQKLFTDFGFLDLTLAWTGTRQAWACYPPIEACWKHGSKKLFPDFGFLDRTPFHILFESFVLFGILDSSGPDPVSAILLDQIRTHHINFWYAGLRTQPKPNHRQ